MGRRYYKISIYSQLLLRKQKSSIPPFFPPCAKYYINNNNFKMQFYALLIGKLLSPFPHVFTCFTTLGIGFYGITSIWQMDFYLMDTVKYHNRYIRRKENSFDNFDNWPLCQLCLQSCCLYVKYSYITLQDLLWHKILIITVGIARVFIPSSCFNM